MTEKEAMVDPFLVEAIKNPRHRLTSSHFLPAFTPFGLDDVENYGLVSEADNSLPLDIHNQVFQLVEKGNEAFKESRFEEKNVLCKLHHQQPMATSKTCLTLPVFEAEAAFRDKDLSSNGLLARLLWTEETKKQKSFSRFRDGSLEEGASIVMTRHRRRENIRGDMLLDTKVKSSFEFAITFLDSLGYSGTGIISRIKPLSVRYGTGLSGSDHEMEGRIVTAEFESFYLMNKQENDRFCPCVVLCHCLLSSVTDQHKRF
ncbi:hypothetical protein Bca101_060367 [Brassica carinata]